MGLACETLDKARTAREERVEIAGIFMYGEISEYNECSLPRLGDVFGSDLSICLKERGCVYCFYMGISRRALVRVGR